MPNHGAAVDSNRHEPKGASTAAAGEILYATGADVTAWLAAGTDEDILTSGGAAAPEWKTIGGDVGGTVDALTVTDLTIASEAQGDILYFNGTNWVVLAAGTAGDFLATQGGAANPIWSSVAQSQTVIDTVRKGSAGTITKGQLVYISGWNIGQSVHEVELAKADSPSTMPAFGMANESITSSANGVIVLLGEVEDINTTGCAANDAIYASAATAGAHTGTRPTGATDVVQIVGRCEREHGSAGVIAMTTVRANDTQNITNGSFWVGDANSVVSEVAGTGTGSVVRATSPTIVTPTIASFTGANHDHSDAAGGGVLTSYAVLAGQAGGQTLIGGTASSQNLRLQSTSGASAGTVFVGDDGAVVQLGSTAVVDIRLGPTGNATSKDVTLTFNAGTGAAVTQRSIVLQGSTGIPYFGNGISSPTPSGFVFTTTGGDGASVNGGAVIVAGGPSGGASAIGGTVAIRGGAAIGGTAGNVNIGDSNTVAVNIAAGSVNVGFFGTTAIAQPADVGALTDSSGGSTDDTVAAVSGSGDDATINDNFAELVENVNAIRAVLSSAASGLGLTA